MWLGLIGKNIKSFVVTKTFLFFFILISQIVCVMATLSVAGMLDAVTPQPTDERGWSSKTFFMSFKKVSENGQDERPTLYKVYDDNNKLLFKGTDEEEYEKFLESMQGNDLSLSTVVTENYAPTDYQSCKEFKAKLINILKECGSDVYGFEIYAKNENVPAVYFGVGGDFLNEETYRSFKQAPNPLIITRSRETILKSPLEEMVVGDKITIGDTEYTAVKVDTLANARKVTVSLPYMSLDDSFLVSDFTITINDDVDQKGILKLKEAISKEFSEQHLDLETPRPKPLLEKQFNNMIYVLSAIMVAAVILNVARLYAYMMSTRRKTLAVFSLCGAAKQKITLVYMSEIILTMLFSFAVGCSVFHFGLRPLIAQVFPTFTTFFTSQIYLLIFGIYMVVGTIIMTFNIVPIIKKSVNDLTK